MLFDLYRFLYIKEYLFPPLGVIDYIREIERDYRAIITSIFCKFIIRIRNVREKYNNKDSQSMSEVKDE